MNAPTGKRNKQNPFFARENHVRLAKIDKNKSEFFGTVGGEGDSQPPALIADLPYDGFFIPAVLAADQIGFNLTGPLGTPPAPPLTTGNGQALTGGILVANTTSGRIDLQLAGPGTALFKTDAGLTVTAIVMQFDDEPTFFMTENGGVRYRNNSALVMAQYLLSKVGIPVRMRILVQTAVTYPAPPPPPPPNDLFGPYTLPSGTYYWIKEVAPDVASIGFNIDDDPPPDIFVTPEQVSQATEVSEADKQAIHEKLIELGFPGMIGRT